MRKTASILERADAEAEGLLGLVRMAIAATLGIVMFLAVSTTSRPDNPFLEAQLLVATAIVASYFLVGLATFVVVRLGRYQMWMAWVSATLDVVLIAGNVWSSLNNTGAHSLFALSFPSALMVPLIMTFGALRFRPLIQIAMTVLMGVLITAIVFSGPLDARIDINTLQFMTITYGVPPNIMRIVMIMAAGGVIALAAWRARRLLEQVAIEVEQRANLTRFLPHEIAGNMTNASVRQLREGRTADLAIMFVDIRGFTHLAEHMPPGVVSRLLSEYRSHILDIAETNHGVVDKFIGDGALILFGMAHPNQARAPARQAIDAATTLLARVSQWNDGLKSENRQEIAIGIGLHYGNVVVGAIGDERRLEFTVIGDEVNVASRVEQATKTLKTSLLATDAIIQHAAASNANWHDLGDIELRGRETMVRLWAYHEATDTSKHDHRTRSHI